jgi:hypothetical protein
MRQLRVGLTGVVLMSALVTPTIRAQQVADTAFRYPVANPAYPQAEGPRVCVDSGHRNALRIDGRYAPFARLLEDDGFRVADLPGTMDDASLEACDLLVIANAGDVAGPPPPGYPHPSAFTKSEHDALLTWVLRGGALWIFMDHPPYVGAMSTVASLMGFQLFDGYVGPTPSSPTWSAVFGNLDEEALRQTTDAHGMPFDRFRKGLGDPGTLANHPILQGRAPEEAVDRVVSFTGTAFFPSSGVEPLLVFGPTATGVVVLAGNVRGAPAGEYPLFALGGWLLGGSRRIGQGRVVLLSEAAMCSAQIAGQQRIPGGFNMPFAERNAQFCLNVAHWLMGLMD